MQSGRDSADDRIRAQIEQHEDRARLAEDARGEWKAADKDVAELHGWPS
jgi:hypothetical protein